MTDATLPPSAASLRQTVEARLKKRHAQELRFRLYGRMAIIVALTFLAVLLGCDGRSGAGSSGACRTRPAAEASHASNSTAAPEYAAARVAVMCAEGVSDRSTVSSQLSALSCQLSARTGTRCGRAGLMADG